MSRTSEERKELRHPVAGMLAFSHAVFHPAETFEQQRLVLCSPLPEHDTAAKLARLLEAG